MFAACHTVTAADVCIVTSHIVQLRVRNQKRLFPRSKAAFHINWRINCKLDDLLPLFLCQPLFVCRLKKKSVKDVNSHPNSNVFSGDRSYFLWKQGARSSEKRNEKVVLNLNKKERLGRVQCFNYVLLQSTILTNEGDNGLVSQEPYLLGLLKRIVFTFLAVLTATTSTRATLKLYSNEQNKNNNAASFTC